MCAFFACADAPPVLQAPVSPPATATDALGLGLTLADVTLRTAAATRNVTASTEAVVSVQPWSAEVARRRQPVNPSRMLGASATLDLHLTISQYDIQGTLTGTITNAFDDRPARAAFQAGRRVLVAVAPDELAPDAWRVWHAWAVGADGTLAEPALGSPAGSSLDRLLTE